MIETLTTQIRDQRKAFEARSKVPIGANLYDRLSWNLDEQDAAKLAEDVSKFLDETDLPTEVKDQLADKNYDYQKPYRQNLRSFIDSQTLAKNLAIMVAAARALRNSDHVDKAEKLKLLREILFVWKQLVQTGLLLANEMVSDSVVSYEGVLFIADWAGKAEQSPEQRLTHLIYSMPLSASRLFYADLATRRMGPLFEAALADEQDQILRFFTVMQVVQSKPKDWVTIVGDYIAATKSGSFYLWSLQTALRTEYRTAFNSPEHKEGVRALLVRIVAKHQLDISYPNVKTTKQIEEGIKDQLDK